MPDIKQDVVDMLRELAELTMLDEGDPQSFRVRAYESAQHGVENYAGDLQNLDAKQLQKIEGVGKSTAEKIRELVEHGRVAKLETLRQAYPPSIVALLNVQGLGPKAVKRLRAELGVESLADLERVVAERKIRELKGFGAKSEEKLAQTLERMRAQNTTARTPVSVALPLAERVVAQLAELSSVSHASYCGSLRRFSETVGDIDILVVAEDPQQVMDTVTSLRVVDRVLGRGDTKTSVVTRRGTQIDVRVVNATQLGAAQLYFTGSKGHNIKLRQRALARGLTLNEYALARIDDGSVVASLTEREIYAALDLPFIPPELREDGGEIEAAERRALPASLGPVLGDFHVHSELSRDARPSLAALITAAKERGYKALAITEHAEGVLAGVGREPLLEQKERIRALRAELGDSLRLLHGVELNIGKNGELDYDDEFRRSFDFCLASVHDHFELDRETQTRRIVTAMKDPSVRMIGHLSARQIGARPPIDLDLDAVFATAAETGTALEINGSLPRLDLSLEALRRARNYAVTFVVTSDAHEVPELNRIDYAVLQAQRAWVTSESVVNTGSAERLLAWTEAKKPALS
ncbi:MAG TPA: DNA polymerase/3'-5' exonuclease PolX [Polyangiales bacterium]|nr:DNA polymerase/3'-5' exonuclease PolX [Polyangiales bacterium]